MQHTIQVQGFDPDDVDILDEYRTRQSPPTEKEINDMADSMTRLRGLNQPHQLQPGVVRIPVLEGGKFGKPVLIAGEARLKAERALNTALGKGEDPYLFYATTVQADDLAAAVSSVIENTKRRDVTPFDRAIGMSLLRDKGLKLEEIGQIYGVKKSHVSDTLSISNLPAKCRKLYEQGKVDEVGLRDLSRYSTKDGKVDDDYLDELIAIAENTQVQKDTIRESAGERKSETEAEAKAAAKAAKEGKSAPVSDAVKGKKSGRIAASTIREAAEATGRKKPKKKKAAQQSDRRRSTAQLISTLHGLFTDESITENVPEPVLELCAGVEKFVDRSISDDARAARSLRDTILNCCKTRFAKADAA